MTSRTQPNCSWWTWKFRNPRQATKNVDSPQMISRWDEVPSHLWNPSIVIPSFGVRSQKPSSVQPVSSGPESSNALSRTRHPSTSIMWANFPFKRPLHQYVLYFSSLYRPSLPFREWISECWKYCSQVIIIRVVSRPIINITKVYFLFWYGDTNSRLDPKRKFVLLRHWV